MITYTPMDTHVYSSTFIGLVGWILWRINPWRFLMTGFLILAYTHLRTHANT